MTAFGNSLIILAATILFVGGVALLGLGAWVWARAIADVFRARAHRISADAQEETVEATQDALGELRSRRDEYIEPTDAELRASAREDALQERMMYAGDITTGRNEEVEETPPIPPDSLYVREEA